MSDSSHPASWLGPLEIDATVWPGPDEPAFVRLWRAFMTTRVAVALIVLLLQGWAMGLSPAASWWPAVLSAIYLSETLAVRLLARAKPPGPAFESQWPSTVGIDILAFTSLQVLQIGGINYAPLFALPLLMASVLGSIMLALGTAAAITLLLLAEAWWMTWTLQVETAARFLQAGLTGIGFFVLSFLTHHLASRLARQEQLTRNGQQAAKVQAEVNELVIENLSDGVLVLDSDGMVRATNPAARRLLGVTGIPGETPFGLAADEAWQALAQLAQLTLRSGLPQQAEVGIGQPGQGSCQVRVNTRQTANTGYGQAPLCVMFLQDLRELEARLRTEKLAAMGRMSAAVAHEIRNPLAAISQANDLLDEDLSQHSQKQLTLMVRQNAQRLDRIVEDILDITRVQQHNALQHPATLILQDHVKSICRDWSQQNGAGPQLSLALDAHISAGTQVIFEADHLRRVLVNLLDNARRYASSASGSIRIRTQNAANARCLLQVWSDGAPLERSVEQHLFEPFFSSESRSSGLGLYICRELCERHGASIGYQRTLRESVGGPQDGNEFFVFFHCIEVTSSAPDTSQLEIIRA